MACWHVRGLVTSLLCVTLNAWPDGADPRACGDMTPQHTGGWGREQPSFYFISLSNTTYTPGVPITVSLKSIPGRSFKGFLIQARVVDPGINFNRAVGTFTPVQGTTRLCDGNIALTHMHNQLKSELSFEWNPPLTLQGKVQFLTTFVESKFSFWIRQTSDVLNEGMTTTSTATSTPTTPYAKSSIPTSPPATSPTQPTTIYSSTESNTDHSSSTWTHSSPDTRLGQDNDSSSTPSVRDVAASHLAETSLNCLIVSLLLGLVT